MVLSPASIRRKTYAESVHCFTPLVLPPSAIFVDTQADKVLNVKHSFLVITSTAPHFALL